MGFDAIWISPMPENSDDGYYGYWATDLYQLNSNFGDQSQLQALIDAAHERGMYVMLETAMLVQPATETIRDTLSIGQACNILNVVSTTEIRLLSSNAGSLITCSISTPKTQTTWPISTTSSPAEWATTALMVPASILSSIIAKIFWSSYTEAAGVFATGE